MTNEVILLCDTCGTRDEGPPGKHPCVNGNRDGTGCLGTMYPEQAVEVIPPRDVRAEARALLEADRGQRTGWLHPKDRLDFTSTREVALPMSDRAYIDRLRDVLARLLAEGER